MTSGSWTFGTSTTPLFARKSWSGGDGKTESWFGGIRSKWNNYDLLHHNHSQRGGAPIVGPISEASIASVKTYVGWTSNDDLRLLNKLAEAVRGHSFDLGINMAEMHKTYGTVLTNLRSIGAALYDLKHGQIVSALRTLGAGQVKTHRQLKAKDLSGRWLETQYAFLPLIDQSYQAAKAMEAISRGRSLKFSARSRTYRVTRNESSSPAGYNYPTNWTYSKKILANLYEELSLGRSLGLTNPAAIAWEVVPYSFVVDWFLPVGSYLAAWGVIPALTGRFLTIERAGAKGGVVGPGTSGTGATYVAQHKRETFFRMLRTPSSSLSVPRPTFNKLPKALSYKHLTNAVALIHQRLR